MNRVHTFNWSTWFNQSLNVPLQAIEFLCYSVYNLIYTKISLPAVLFVFIMNHH